MINPTPAKKKEIEMKRTRLWSVPAGPGLGGPVSVLFGVAKASPEAVWAEYEIGRLTDEDIAAAYLEVLVPRFRRAEGDLAEELRIVAEVSRWDVEHPADPTLLDQLFLAVAGDEPGLVAA